MVKKNDRNVLVTGGAGYIGSTVVHDLIEEGYNVIVFDNLSNGHREAVDPRANFIEDDLSDQKAIERTLSVYAISSVFHFAASIEAGKSMKQPAKYFRNNTQNTLNLLEAMRKTGVNRLIFSSTAAVYGEPEQMPITEESPTNPTNFYGFTKLADEYLIKWYEKLFGLQCIAFRYFNACGATEELGEDHSPETHLIPNVFKSLEQGKKLQIFGDDYPTDDDTCVRDYVHVQDLSSAHILGLHALEEGQSGEIYNIGSGKGYSNLKVVDAIEKVTGKKVDYEITPRRPGDPAVLVASSEKAEKELGWERKFDSVEAIVLTVYDWRKSHPNGYSK